jgi:hypothetical protein
MQATKLARMKVRGFGAVMILATAIGLAGCKGSSEPAETGGTGGGSPGGSGGSNGGAGIDAGAGAGAGGGGGSTVDAAPSDARPGDRDSATITGDTAAGCGAAGDVCCPGNQCASGGW